MSSRSLSSRSIFQSHRTTLAVLVLLSVLGMSVALADDESDPPGRVARLSYTNGSVSLQPAGVQDWGDAIVNRPLTTGDKLWTDQDSRAELDMGVAAIRLGSTTGFSFLNLDDRTVQMNVTAGTAIVHVRSLNEGQSFEVDTPNVAVALQSPGDYRVEVNDAGDSTVVKVSNGDAEVSATGSTMPLHTQQAYVFSGTNDVTADATSVGAPDPLDSWSLEREHRFDQAQAQTQEYVPPEMAGAEDLGAYGSWEETQEYGPVWTPTVVAAGWSPYHYGRWVWVAPWGWTWVDDAPWGFAPFHYGRWAYRGTRWCWVPGPRHMRPVYAPALVAWVGSPGGSVTVVSGAPRVGWFPLGPREVYVPAYRVSHNYVRNVNVTNTTIVNTTYITNVYENRVTNITYANRNRPGAVVAVSQDVFTSARPISGRTVRLPDSDLTRVGVRGAAPAIAPVRESVLGNRPDTNIRRPPATIVNRPVVARTAPPPAPVPFDRQQAAIRANGGRPLARSEITALQPAAATSQRVRVVAPGPVRPIPNREQSSGAGAGGTGPGTGGQQFGTARSMQDRERMLHATPMTPNQGPAYRTDRPPQAPQPARPTPEARPVEQPQALDQRPVPRAHPLEQRETRITPSARPSEPSRVDEMRQEAQRQELQQRQQMQQRQELQQRQEMQQRQAQQELQQRQAQQELQQRQAIQQRQEMQQRQELQQRQEMQQRQELQQRQQMQQRQEAQARPEFRAEPPRQMPRPEPPRAEPRQMEMPRAAPPQPRQAPPPQQQQQRNDDRRGGRPNEPRNRP